MRTERILSIILALVLLASVVPLAITPVAAAYEKKIPCDADGNNELTKDELVNAILPYMLGEGDLKLDDVGDAAYVYAYWDGKPKTITDSLDRTVTVYRPIERLVVCFPHALETLRSLKMPKERIVGLAKRWPEYDPSFFSETEIGDIPCVGDRWTPNLEKIVALRPDAVIYTSLSIGPKYSSPIVDVLEPTNIVVTCFRFNSFEIYREEVEKLASILGKEEEAEEFLDWRENILNSIKEKVDTIPEEDKPRVYAEFGSYKIYGEYAYIAMAGGKDIFADKPGSYMSVDPEAVADRDPEIIVKLGGTAGGYDLDAGDTAELEKARAEILNRDILQNVTAVKNKKVYVITTHLISCFGDSGCRGFIQVAYMAKWFHPELFEDLDPKAIHQEYLTRFQGLDIDLDKKGVFVYPEP